MDGERKLYRRRVDRVAQYKRLVTLLDMGLETSYLNLSYIIWGDTLGGPNISRLVKDRKAASQGNETAAGPKPWDDPQPLSAEQVRRLVQLDREGILEIPPGALYKHEVDAAFGSIDAHKGAIIELAKAFHAARAIVHKYPENITQAHRTLARLGLIESVSGRGLSANGALLRLHEGARRTHSSGDVFVDDDKLWQGLKEREDFVRRRDAWTRMLRELENART